MDSITSFNNLRHVGIAFLLYIEEPPVMYDDLISRFGEDAKITIAEMIDIGRIEIIDNEIIFIGDKKRLTPVEIAIDDARVSYPGVKMGLAKTIAALKKHKDWRLVVPKLIPAINREKEWMCSRRNAGLFCPEWQNMPTWINQRGWEKEFNTPEISIQNHIYVKYLAKKNTSYPTSGALTEEQLMNWVNKTGPFAGINQRVSAQRQVEVFWMSHLGDNRTYTHLLNGV